MLIMGLFFIVFSSILFSLFKYKLCSLLFFIVFRIQTLFSSIQLHSALFYSNPILLKFNFFKTLFSWFKTLFSWFKTLFSSKYFDYIFSIYYIFFVSIWVGYYKEHLFSLFEYFLCSLCSLCSNIQDTNSIRMLRIL